MRTIHLVLADDHLVVRQGLRALLESQAAIHVVGETGDGLEAVELVEQLRPDVLVVDLMMPGLSGLEVTRQVRQRFPNTRIVILSMHSGEPYVMEALRNGAEGYVLKTSSAADLTQAVSEVMEGRRYLSPPLSLEAVELFTQKTRDTTLDLYETLTTREQQVLQLAARGLSRNEISSQLSISPHTAMTHRTNLMRKLGLHNQTELVRFAIQRRLLPLE